MDVLSTSNNLLLVFYSDRSGVWRDHGILQAIVTAETGTYHVLRASHGKTNTKIVAKKEPHWLRSFCVLATV